MCLFNILAVCGSLNLLLGNCGLSGSEAGGILPSNYVRNVQGERSRAWKSYSGSFCNIKALILKFHKENSKFLFKGIFM